MRGLIKATSLNPKYTDINKNKQIVHYKFASIQFFMEWNVNLTFVLFFILTCNFHDLSCKFWLETRTFLAPMPPLLEKNACK